MNNIKETAILLDKMKIYAHHGVLEQELAVGNIFEITLRVRYPFEPAMKSDDVADTLNYALLYDVVKKEMDIPSRLLEHVASRIINAICIAFPLISGGYICVTKPNPPIIGEMAGVSVEVTW